MAARTERAPGARSSNLTPRTRGPIRWARRRRPAADADAPGRPSDEEEAPGEQPRGEDDVPWRRGRGSPSRSGTRRRGPPGGIRSGTARADQVLRDEERTDQGGNRDARPGARGELVSAATQPQHREEHHGSDERPPVLDQGIRAEPDARTTGSSRSSPPATKLPSGNSPPLSDAACPRALGWDGAPRSRPAYRRRGRRASRAAGHVLKLAGGGLRGLGAEAVGREGDERGSVVAAAPGTGADGIAVWRTVHVIRSSKRALFLHAARRARALLHKLAVPHSETRYRHKGRSPGSSTHTRGRARIRRGIR